MLLSSLPRTYTLTTLPTSGVIRVYATTERYTLEDLAFGAASDRGYAQRVGSSEIYDSRNDVAPVLEIMLPLDDDDREEIANFVASLGSIEAGERGTIYLTGTENDDLQSSDTFSVAVHAHIKVVGSHGHVEVPLDLIG